jgi:hypothetical protein
MGVISAILGNLVVSMVFSYKSQSNSAACLDRGSGDMGNRFYGELSHNKTNEPQPVA